MTARGGLALSLARRNSTMARLLCDICGVRPATIRVAMLQNGRRQVLDVCDYHYAQITRHQRSISPVEACLASRHVRKAMDRRNRWKARSRSAWNSFSASLPARCCSVPRKSPCSGDVENSTPSICCMCWPTTPTSRPCWIRARESS